MENEKTIATNLYRIRNGKNETQEQVAASVGISSVSLSRYETGQRMPKMDILAKLAKYYGVTVDEIIGADTGNTKKYPAAEQLDKHLIDSLVNLSPADVQRVQDFVAGLKASRKG